MLYQGRHSAWLYDWQAACKMAREDGWNTEPFDAPNRTERAVQADFDRLRGWLNNEWYYVGVVVTAPDGKDASLWGIESDCDEYLDEVAVELAEELLEPRRKAWRKALAERRELRAWQRLAAVQAAVLGTLCSNI